jgi:hypothetical protein
MKKSQFAGYQQIEKLNEATRLAKEAEKSLDVATRLGASVLYAGMMDFMTIQTARLVEQILLKGQIAIGQEPSFVPHEDDYFYNSKISTKKILEGIKKLLPLKPLGNSPSNDVQRVTELAREMLNMGFEFLKHRNAVVHHIGRPDRTLSDIVQLCDEANRKFEQFLKAHTAFFKAAQPYIFSDEERRYFYGQKT